MNILSSVSKQKNILIGGLVVLIMLSIIFITPAVIPLEPLQMNTASRLQFPSSEHIFGTDNFGRDIFARIVYGGRTSMKISASTMIISSIAGTLLALYSGYYKKADMIIMRFLDGLMAFPPIILGIAIMAFLGPSDINVIIALSIVYIPRTARVVRSSVLSIREKIYVEAARSSGASDIRIMFIHILPNSLSPLLVQSTFIFASAVIAEAGLSFLGIGSPPPNPSWGNILADARIYMRALPTMAIFPGAFIAIMVLGLNVLGDGLRDYLDPRKRN